VLRNWPNSKRLNMEASLLSALTPVITLLALGIVTIVVSRAARLGAIVGYLLLGIVLSATKIGRPNEAVGFLAELGVVFLLFDVGLHFSPRHLREQVLSVFGMGSLQMILGTIGLGLGGLALGMPARTAFFIGATLALSSTAVAARVIADRHQQSCPVGLAATGILVFQDVAAIFLLIIAAAMATGSAIAPALATALLGTVAAVATALVAARFVVRPLFDLVARSRNEEVFTAIALFVALAAAWITGRLGLSLTLGSFLGGMMLSDSPYRAIIQSEIRPFRGLLLGFFFISVGMSLDTDLLRTLWPTVLLLTTVLVAAKVLLNALASLGFRWSVPGSLQLGFLLAQSSEFALVIFSLPSVRSMIGDERAAVLIASVVLSLGATPHVAAIGRTVAGRLRLRKGGDDPAEMQPRELIGPVLIVGMGARGRTIADAMVEFEIPYTAIESDPSLMRQATADGYHVVFGDLADARIWTPAAMQDRKISVLTMPSIERSKGITPIARSFYPGLTRIAVVDSPGEAAQFASIGLEPVVEETEVPGLTSAIAVLKRLDVDAEAAESWGRRRLRAASRN
jgi:Kef-type K+ transport system membrane component KefB